MRCLRLPFDFDPARLRADLARVAPDEWIPHMQRRHYDGQWSGAALRSIGGASENIVPDARDGATFHATALLDRCPYFREVLATFHCPLQAVRLLRLHAGSSIAEHVDHALDFDDGEVRIHIPIVTSDDVKFYLDGARLVMAPGECWYTNVNLPHSVDNRGATDRIHLVIDCHVDDWLRGVFATTPRPRCDHYAAQLESAAAPAPGPLLELFSGFAAPPIKFHSERTSLILTWPGTQSWQLRLRLPGSEVSASARWISHLESSPDPEQQHRHDYDALVASLTAAFPGFAVAHEGIAYNEVYASKQ